MSKSKIAFTTDAVTDKEYLRIERQAFEKSELIGSEFVAIANASERHNIISSNILLDIGVQTKNTRCGHSRATCV